MSSAAPSYGLLSTTPGSPCRSVRLVDLPVESVTSLDELT